MPAEIGLWRVDGQSPIRLSSTGVPLESQLESFIEADPSLLGETLLLVGRQVPTQFGGFIDLLAVDADGVLHVLELKRDRTPREVVAQIIDYGSWVATLGHNDVIGRYAEYKGDVPFEAAFAERFGQSPPEELNRSQVLTVVATGVDPATERIVRYLSEGFAVPLNVVFFRYFEDDGRAYVGRTWLVDSDSTATALAASSKLAKSREPWNGQDWYVSFGEFPEGRRWDDARKYGFVSAGGGEWFSRTLKSLPVGARIFVCIPKAGYVGVGHVLGVAKRFDHAQVRIGSDERKLSDLPLTGGYVHEQPVDTDESAEYVVPVEWVKTLPRDQAIWKSGMFANQNSVCKLRNKFTLDNVTSGIGLAEQ